MWIETVQEFIAKHGGVEPMPISPGVLALPDGATVLTNLGSPGGKEPPADPKQRLEVQRAYHRSKLNKHEKDFKLIKQHILDGTPCSWDAKTYGPAMDDGFENLRLIQRCVLQEREALASIEATIAALPEEQERRQLEESARESHRQLDEQRRQYREAIGRITI